MLINVSINIISLLLIKNLIAIQFCKYAFVYTTFNQNLIKSFVSLIIALIEFLIICISCLAILF